MRLLSQMNSGKAYRLSAPFPIHGARRYPAQCRVRGRWKSVLLDPQPSLLALRRRFPSLFERLLGTTPRSDSSETYMRAVRPKPSPADLRSVGTAGVSEVSRFSCMKFLGVLWGLQIA